MAMRDLTDRERAVLAHVVVDPDAWWSHCCSCDGTNGQRAIDCEAALAAKVARWSGEYDTAVAQPDYKTRAVRQAEEDAARAALQGA
jgi:hypothetical protein